jgi:predicted nucleic acid-binding protein
MNVFVDTSAFYAVLSVTDRNYEKAVSDWNRFIDDESVTLCTSNYVVVESCALIRSRLGVSAVRNFLESLIPLTIVLWVDEKIHSAATEAMIAHGKSGPSIVDCSSFAIMRDNGIVTALSYDKHFSANGFDD